MIITQSHIRSINVISLKSGPRAILGSVPLPSVDSKTEYNEVSRAPGLAAMTMNSSDRPTPNTMTEAQILAASVVPPAQLNGPIKLSPYHSRWPSDYEHLANQIHQALGDIVLQLEHVGSTSVPGLAAKPIIDMVMVVADSSAESTYVPPLEQIGYTLKIREPDWNEHRLLKPKTIDGNLHVFSQGCEEIKKMIRFRDWLRTHPDDRQLYENTKLSLAAKTWKYTQNYADAKSEVIQTIMNRATKG